MFRVKDKDALQIFNRIFKLTKFVLNTGQGKSHIHIGRMNFHIFI